MNLAEEFNSLNGIVVSRDTLERLLLKADKENHYEIQKRIIKVLKYNPDTDRFTIELKNLVEPFGLNGVDQETILPSLPYLSDDDNEGLNAVSPDDVYSYITDLIINTIKQVGHLPWQKEWTGSGADGSAMNYVSKKEYTGANFILNFDIKFDNEGQPYLVPIDFKEPYYLTFNQIKEAKATLKKDSKARRVIYYTMIFNYDSPNLKIKTTDRTKWNNFRIANGLTKEDLRKYLTTIPVLKYYNVFRADDCTGLKFPDKKEKKKTNPIDTAQAIIDGYKNPPKYTFSGDRAFYQPSGDILNMPAIEAFSSEAFYYSTFFHEATHSTGAEKRLNRDFSGRKGDKAYAYEELIAELGAVFLSSEAGILFHTKENSAKYLQSWNNVLINELENDNRFFLRASAQAQKAVNHILGREAVNEETAEEDKPKFEVFTNNNPKREWKRGSKATPKTAQKEKKPILNRSKKTKETVLTPEPVKIDKNGQYALLGAAKKGLNAPRVVAKPIAKEKKEIDSKSNLNKNSLAYKMANRPKNVDYFKIDNKDIATFLGKIEHKQKESIVISLTGGQGSMKTRMCFQFINALAQTYKTGHASIEEHPESSLYYDKAEEYLNAKALQNIENPEIRSVEDLEKLIRNNEVIIIDSFSKMQEMHKGFEVDKDLRKKYDGKLFIVIFQQTTDGKMRGGSKSQFDADIVLFTEKMANYKDNYIYADKNRYQNKPLDELKFNIFNKKLVQDKTEEVAEPTTKKKLSFNVN